MTLVEPLPELSDILASIGEGGRRVAQIDAGEGAAGNISVCIGWPSSPRRHFPVVEEIRLPVPAPNLAGHTVIVTGSGRRLRDIATDTQANLGAVRVLPDGETGLLHTSPRRLFERLTSEWNSHLAVHDDTVARTGTNYPRRGPRAAAPPGLPVAHPGLRRRGRASTGGCCAGSRRPSSTCPQGVGVLPFMVPGSAELMAANVESLRAHRIVLWSKHGVMARSDVSVTRAVDRIEYAETAARYEYMDLAVGGLAQGVTDDELAAVVQAFEVKTTVI